MIEPIKERRGLAPSLLKCLFESEDTGKEEIEMTTKGSKSASDDPPERKPASSVNALIRIIPYIYCIINFRILLSVGEVLPFSLSAPLG